MFPETENWITPADEYASLNGPLVTDITDFAHRIIHVGITARI
jgi:hypothetical protein